VLAPGDVVVMDNLSSHKVQGVCERIKSAGAELLYLPPYSPDLKPIDKAWSKLKQMLRTARRTAVKNSTMQSEMPFQTLPRRTPRLGSEPAMTG